MQRCIIAAADSSGCSIHQFMSESTMPSHTAVMAETSAGSVLPARPISSETPSSASLEIRCV